MKNDFLPTKHSDIVVMIRNFVGTLDGYTDKLNLHPDDVIRSKEILNSYIQSHADMISKRAESKAATENHNAKKSSGVEEFRRIAKVIKFSSKYEESIGDALGIIGPQVAKNDPTENKPVLTIKSLGHAVRIKFLKKRNEGIAIYAKRDNDPEFKILGQCTYSPFLDTLPNIVEGVPEVRQYYAVYTFNGSETGNRSDIVKVTVS